MGEGEEMKKKKYPSKWLKQFWLIKLYEPVGFFRRRIFFVFASTHNTAVRKITSRYKDAKPLLISPFVNDFYS